MAILVPVGIEANIRGSRSCALEFTAYRQTDIVRRIFRDMEFNNSVFSVLMVI